MWPRHRSQEHERKQQHHHSQAFEIKQQHHHSQEIEREQQQQHKLIRSSFGSNQRDCFECPENQDPQKYNVRSHVSLPAPGEAGHVEGVK